MSDRPPPKRYESDANFRIPPEVLAKCSDSNAPPPVLAEAMLEAQDGPPIDPKDVTVCTLCHGLSENPDGEDTMESCPRCGLGMVTIGAARAYRAAHLTENRVDEAIEIDLTTDPDDQELDSK